MGRRERKLDGGITCDEEREDVMKGDIGDETVGRNVDGREICFGARNIFEVEEYIVGRIPMWTDGLTD